MAVGPDCQHMSLAVSALEEAFYLHQGYHTSSDTYDKIINRKGAHCQRFQL